MADNRKILAQEMARVKTHTHTQTQNMFVLKHVMHGFEDEEGGAFILVHGLVLFCALKQRKREGTGKDEKKRKTTTLRTYTNNTSATRNALSLTCHGFCCFVVFVDLFSFLLLFLLRSASWTCCWLVVWLNAIACLLLFLGCLLMMLSVNVRE